LASFSRGDAQTLVATDIAARGIHVDDVRLVVHADPPAEHKAYLHRSGRTARAGAEGTVVTLVAPAQLPEVRALTKKAGVRPTISHVSAADPFLQAIAPGARVLSEPLRPTGQRSTRRAPDPPSRPRRHRTRGATSAA
jgi:superfamily II DNA/RNA helicase